MTLLAIRTQIITEIGGRTDLSDVIDDQINFAAAETATMNDFPELDVSATTTTRAGDAEYLLPSDVYLVWSVKEETNLNRKLIYKSYDHYQNLDETITGQPNNYTVRNRHLILFGQVPDDNDGSDYLIRINYWKVHPLLTQDNDSLLLPFEWERVIRLRATAYMFTILDQDDKAQAKHAEADRAMSRLRLPKSAQKERAKTAGLNFGNPF